MREESNQPGDHGGADRNNHLTTALDFLLQRGQLSLIVGPQSSGKTALCVSLLTELEVVNARACTLLSGQKSDGTSLSVNSESDFVFLDALPRPDWPEAALKRAGREGPQLSAPYNSLMNNWQRLRQ
jgi:hypothetical protein